MLDVHVAVAFDALGVQLGSREVAATEAGYRSLLGWARELGVPAFAVEGCGSYGAGLAACGAALQSELVREELLTQFTKRELRRISRRSCNEALRNGIIDAADARGLLDCRVDQEALNAIILRVAKREA